MKPDWDQLGSTYEGSSSVLIADVDCTVEQELCQKHGIQGYPTIKYYNAETGNDGEKYNGGRDFDSLSNFVTENLSKACDINDSEATCDEKELKFLAKFQAKSSEDQEKEQDRLQRMAGSKMKAEQKQFLNQRLAILRQLLA